MSPESGSSDRKSTRLNSSHLVISYAVFCLKKKYNTPRRRTATPVLGCPSVHIPLAAGSPAPADTVCLKPLSRTIEVFRHVVFFFKEPGPPRTHPFSPTRRSPD